MSELLDNGVVYDDEKGEEGEALHKLCRKLGLSYYDLQEYEKGWVVGLDYTSME